VKATRDAQEIRFIVWLIISLGISLVDDAPRGRHRQAKFREQIRRQALNGLARNLARLKSLSGKFGLTLKGLRQVAVARSGDMRTFLLIKRCFFQEKRILTIVQLSDAALYFNLFLKLLVYFRIYVKFIAKVREEASLKAVDIRKDGHYDPEQPRNPAGSGEASGRWTKGNAESSSPGPGTRRQRQRIALSGTLIDKRYDEVYRVTHCTYATPLGTYTIEHNGYRTCDDTTPAPNPW